MIISKESVKTTSLQNESTKVLNKNSTIYDVEPR